MSLNDLWKKFIRDDNYEEESDDTASYYKPRRRAAGSPLVDEPDDDIFASPKSRATRDEYDFDEDEAYADDGMGKPRFKRVMATGLKSAERAVELVLAKYVVLVNSEGVSDESLTPFRCYLAGAIRALDAHITPVDDENIFISIEPFDATPYLPREEQGLDEQEDDLI